MAKKPQAKPSAAPAEAKAAEAKATKLIRMVRDESAFPAPHSADVHPDEAENFRAGGWQEA